MKSDNTQHKTKAKFQINMESERAYERRRGGDNESSIDVFGAVVGLVLILGIYYIVFVRPSCNETVTPPVVTPEQGTVVRSSPSNTTTSTRQVMQRENSKMMMNDDGDDVDAVLDKTYKAINDLNGGGDDARTRALDLANDSRERLVQMASYDQGIEKIASGSVEAKLLTEKMQSDEKDRSARMQLQNSNAHEYVSLEGY